MTPTSSATLTARAQYGLRVVSRAIGVLRGQIVFEYGGGPEHWIRRGAYLSGFSILARRIG